MGCIAKAQENAIESEGSEVKRGEVWWAELPEPAGRRPVVLVSNDRSYDLRSKIIVVEVTTRARGLDTEIPIGSREGLPKKCWANTDNIFTIDKFRLRQRTGSLDARKIEHLDRALAFSLGLTTD